MRVDLFDYHLPRELIAAEPAAERDHSRLLVLHRANGRIEHRRFDEIADYLRAGDVLVLNDSRVIRARLHGKRTATGGGVEFLLLERAPSADEAVSRTCDVWRVMCRPAKKLKPGEIVYFANKRLQARILHYCGEGEREVEFSAPDVMLWLNQIGEIPLPPYIIQRRRELGWGSGHLEIPSDAERYQTVYAREPGSVAAPTAGLHFTPQLLERMKDAGVQQASVTLHVGAGTFKPVETQEAEDHVMHTEHSSISHETAATVNDARRDGRRVVAVGTTAVRTLETVANPRGMVQDGQFETSLMILPGYRFKCVDALITNFHLPRSTLLMLVSAFAGRELILRAYKEAIAQHYRFFSYGDAMLIL